MIQIRPFAPPDYDQITAIHNLAMPRDVTSSARIRDWDENRPDHLLASRWVAELSGQVVAVAEYSQSPDLYHPRKFQIAVTVHPDHQNHGMGSTLYNHVTRALQTYDPVGYQARAYADQARTLRFLAARGFREDFRQWESHLDVTSFNPRPWPALEERLQRDRIEIKALSELPQDERRDRALFELERETTAEIPSPASVTSHREDLTPEKVEERFARYVKRALNHPDRPLDAYFVAMKNGEYIGLTYFEVDREHRRAEILMTGVRRQYRGSGIATALKLRGVAYARQNGYRTIVTGNDTLNRPILTINERMGFVRQPELIFFEKPIPARSETLAVSI